MAIRVSPGVEKTHECQGHKKSESRNGTQLAETIMASGKHAASTGRTQDSTRPRHVETSKRTCKKGAIHTRHSCGDACSTYPFKPRGRYSSKSTLMRKRVPESSRPAKAQYVPLPLPDSTTKKRCLPSNFTSA